MTGKNRVLALLSLLFLACSALPVVGQTKELGRLLNDARKASENGEHQLADSLRQAWVERFRSEGHARAISPSRNCASRAGSSCSSATRTAISTMR